MGGSFRAPAKEDDPLVTILAGIEKKKELGLERKTVSECESSGDEVEGKKDR